VKHPEHIKDVARAFAWTCENIADYGGDPDRLFVGGHSAGGHLAALLATDPEWLEAEGRSVKNIQGVIGVSGVYCLDDVNYDFKWSVAGPRDCFKCQGEIQPLSAIFGRGDDVLKDASPITHVRGGLPPFLLLTGGLDFCPMKRTAKKFASALKDAGCDVESRSISWRTHDTLLFDIVHQTADKKMSRAVIDFINDR
jgi:acetyl esterase/lipase